MFHQKNKYNVKRLISSFHFCMGIGLNQLIPEFKKIDWFENKPFYAKKLSDVKYIKPKMFNVKPQPFSIQKKKI